MRVATVLASAGLAAGAEWTKLDAVRVSSAGFEGVEMYCPAFSCLESMRSPEHVAVKEDDAWLCRYGKAQMFGARPTLWTDLTGASEAEKRAAAEAAGLSPASTHCADNLLPAACCNLARADCLACAARVPVSQLCAQHGKIFGPSLAGCRGAGTPPVTVGISPKGSKGKATYFTKTELANEGKCCHEMSADCLSCSVGLTVDEYCIKSEAGDVGFRLPGCERYIKGDKFKHTWAPTPAPGAAKEPAVGEAAVSCRTVDGPTPGRSCAFPFRWNGETHWNCAQRDLVTSVSWCATKTDAKGEAIHGSWGNCGKCTARVNCAGAWVPASGSACSKTCGGGTRKYVFMVTRAANEVGAPCATAHGAIQVRKCNADLCPAPINCVGKWGPLTPCSRRCNGGTQHRTFHMTTRAQHGGTMCWPEHDTTQMIKCNARKCTLADNGIGSIKYPRPANARDCKGSWDAWSPCSAPCGSGERHRTYRVHSPARFGGKPWTCPRADGDLQTAWCNSWPCGAKHNGWEHKIAVATAPPQGTPVPTPSPTPACVIGHWKPWGFCSKTCGVGFRTRTRLVRAHSGAGCPADFEVKVCTLQNCPTPSPVTARSIAGLADSAQQQHYSQLQQRNSELEGHLAEVSAALTHQLRVVDPDAVRACEVSAFSAWSDCTVTCGGGLQAATRSILSPGAHPSDCPDLVQTRSCNQAACPISDVATP